MATIAADRRIGQVLLQRPAAGPATPPPEEDRLGYSQQGSGISATDPARGCCRPNAASSIGLTGLPAMFGSFFAAPGFKLATCALALARY
jgi:hypothetical protein